MFNLPRANILAQGDKSGNILSTLVEIGYSFSPSFEWKMDYIFKTYIRSRDQCLKSRKKSPP